LAGVNVALYLALGPDRRLCRSTLPRASGWGAAQGLGL